jgi:hypothetical protein
MLSSRSLLIAAGVIVIVAGAALNWSLLVALGLAPILISLMPCAAMCALGLFMTRSSGSHRSEGNTDPRGEQQN